MDPWTEKQLNAYVDSLPPGTRFTTRQAMDAVTYKYATVRKVRILLDQRRDVEKHYHLEKYIVYWRKK